jgi:hypothetical protein
MSPADTIRLALTHGGDAAAWSCLDVALAAAREAGVKAIRTNGHLPPEDQLAVALQAADEALEELAVELSNENGTAAE